RAVGPILLACATWLIAGSAFAQTAQVDSNTGNVGVLERPRPDYEVTGVRLGSFVAYPRVTVRAAYDDNVFASPNAQSDSIFGLAPALSIRSDWPRHAISLSADADLRRYDKFTSEDTNAWTIAGQGRLDVSHDTEVDVAVSGGDRIEPRTVEVSDVETEKPVRYGVETATVKASHDFNRVRVVGTLDVMRQDYHDARDLSGGVVDEDYRDHTQTDGTVRVAYAVSPASAFFVEGGLRWLNYGRVDGRTRDSQGVTVLIGVDREITRLIVGELSAGYLRQNFEDSFYQPVEKFHYRARLTWYPTPLLTVGLAATQSLDDSELRDAPGVLTQTARVSADYELLRNVIISGQLSGSNEKYRGIDREDRRLGCGLSVNYLANRTLGLSLRYKFDKLASSGTRQGRDFEDNTLSLALVLQR
ncbi:MAG: outer membrane beta-barrel protein, partial [Phenylobacterium sp.]